MVVLRQQEEGIVRDAGVPGNPTHWIARRYRCPACGTEVWVRGAEINDYEAHEAKGGGERIREFYYR